MNGKILAGVVAALVCGGTAVAHDHTVKSKEKVEIKSEEQVQGTGGSGLQQRATSQEINDLQQSDVAPPPVDMSLMGIGGSGNIGNEMGSEMLNQDAIGGSGQSVAPAPQQSGVSLFCTPLPQEAIGGSGAIQSKDSALIGNEQSSLQREFDSQPVHVVSNDMAVGGSGYDAKDIKKEPKDQGQRKGDMRGLTLMVGAGVEGYTGGLAPEVNPGAAVGVTASLKPTKVLGIELGYSGAVNNLSDAVGGSGPDIIRNGGQAALTLGLTAAPVQPYVLGGFGISRYNVRHGEALGFRSDTSSNVPVGVGLRTHIGDFTADARVNYNLMFANDFQTGVDNDLWTGRYTGTLNLGGTF